MYAALGTAQAVFILAASLAMVTGGIYASRKLHDGMLENILRSPMAFFETTPLGRVLNRFSKVWHSMLHVVQCYLLLGCIHY